MTAIVARGKSKKIASTATQLKQIEKAISADSVALLEPMDVEKSFQLLDELDISPKVTILDPWYNKGHGGVRDDYIEYVTRLLNAAAKRSEHVFLWGFPEIVARFVERIPRELELICWLTWYYKNNPSVIRGWRSSQNACLHLGRPGAKLYPEHFLNDAQKKLQLEGKLRYMPGPTSVIEVPLNVGFIGKHEKTGHPSQKPMAVFEQIILMTTVDGDLLFDPMAGSGTTGAVAKKLNRRAILSDLEDDYVVMMEKRLNAKRIAI